MLTLLSFLSTKEGIIGLEKQRDEKERKKERKREREREKERERKKERRKKERKKETHIQTQGSPLTKIYFINKCFLLA